jgi:Uma2 family endonuclease
MTTFLDLTEDRLYPEDDGNPMFESTEQYRWIVVLKENLELLLRDRADVFIAADLAWYPVQVQTPPAPCQAPDVMVVFGRSRGARRSYLQWKEANVGPQVLFEILSASNKTRKGIEAMDYKFQFYEQYGVEEYYIYDPDEFTLEGWQRRGNQLMEISRMSGWVSPRLGIRFDWQPRRELVLYDPNGRQFSSFVEQGQAVEEAQQQVAQERSRTQQAQQQVEAEQLRAEQAELTIQAAVPRLLGLGLNVEQVASALGLSVERVQAIADSESKVIGDSLAP